MTNTTKNGGRQTALNLDGGSFDEAAYRAELIAAGMGVEQAKQVAATAARFLATPEGRAAEAQRLDGFQSLGSIVGASLPTGAKKATAAPKAQPKEPAIIQRTAKPGAIITPQQNKLLDVGAEIAGTKQDEYGEFMSLVRSEMSCWKPARAGRIPLPPLNRSFPGRTSLPA